MEGSKASAQDSLHLLQRNKGNGLPEWHNFYKSLWVFTRWVAQWFLGVFWIKITETPNLERFWMRREIWFTSILHIYL